jgi:hypothetical protein
MALVINKYKILNPYTFHELNSVVSEMKPPKSIPEGTTFEVIGIDMNGFVLRDTRESGNDFKYQFIADVFNQGFYKVGGDV